jgi:hypothetical protein
VLCPSTPTTDLGEGEAADPQRAGERVVAAGVDGIGLPGECARADVVGCSLRYIHALTWAPSCWSHLDFEGSCCSPCLLAA